MDRFVIRKRKSPLPANPISDSEGENDNNECVIDKPSTSTSSECTVETTEAKATTVSGSLFIHKKQKCFANIKTLSETFSWLDPNKNYLFCRFCNIKISGNKFHVRRHEKNSEHVKNANAARLTPMIRSVWQEPEIQRKHWLIKEAELRLCCFIAEKNLPMLLMDTLPLFNCEIYPDSEIAKGVVMKRLKATKLMVGVLGPAFKTDIINDLKNHKFSIIIDETTDLSTKKSLVVVVRYFKHGKTQDRFLDLVEVDSATSESLFNIIKGILDENNIPYCNIIGFASDNASAMMGAIKGVQAKFKEILPYIYVQGCSCHSLHLCASAAAIKLPNSVEQFTRDIYSYFSHSSKRLAELAECQIFANEKRQKMLYPSQTRWLSLKNVVDRILEHWNSLTLFFQRAALEDNLPSAKSILNALQNQEYKIYLLFLAYVLDLVTKVNVELQSESPKLPVLLNRLTALYKTLLRCFIQSSVLNNTPIQNINLNDPSKYVQLENLFAGAKVDALLNSGNLNITKDELKSFRVRVLDFYIELCRQIKKRFNFEDTVLKYAANFTPAMALSGQVMSIANFINLFPQINVNIEAANAEWQLLSEVNIHDLKSDNDINFFWKTVSEQKNSIGELMFKNLMIIVEIILSLPHSSATAERVFSQLTLIKTFLRNRLLITTCAALLHIKDKMHTYEKGVLSWRPDKKIFNYTNTFLENILTE